MYISGNSSPEIVGAITEYLNPFTVIKKITTAPRRIAPTRLISDYQKNVERKKVSTVENAIAAINSLLSQVKGSAYNNVIPLLKNVEHQWGQVHANRAIISKQTYDQTANKVVQVRKQGANVYAADANAHAARMEQLTKSMDYTAISEAVKNYTAWIKFMNGKHTAYTHVHDTYKKAHARINTAFAALKKHAEQVLIILQQKQATFEVNYLKLLSLLKLDSTTAPELAMSKFSDKYQKNPDDVTELKDMMEGAGVSPASPFPDLLPVIIAYIEIEKKKFNRMLLIGAGVAAAGTAAVTLM